MSRVVSWIKLVLAAFACAALFAVPAQAQFSDSYRFLEAVKKKDGQTVTECLSEPGSTIVNTRDLVTGETALHVVTQRRDVAWIRFLAQKGADPNIGNKKGVTPIALASSLGFVEGVEALIAAGARVDEPNQTGETPLIAAVHRRDISVIRALLEAGANPDRADNSGRSARAYAELDGSGSPILAEIRSRAKSSQQQQGAKVYGPSF